MRHPGATLPAGTSLRLCNSPSCANGDLANGSYAASSASHHAYQSLRRSARSAARSSPRRSPSPPPPPPPRYPHQYPTLPINGNACHHYQVPYETISRDPLPAALGASATLQVGSRPRSRDRERNRDSSRRLEQLSASSHQQRQEELEIHHGSLARRDLAGYHA